MTATRPAPQPDVGPHAPGSGRPAWCRWVLGLAAVQVVALIATSARYGYHRDEMYFIAAGTHPAFGYPDQPPLVPLLCAAMNWLATDSLVVLRLPSALAAAAVTVVASLVAREIGGRAGAQLVAAACTGVSALALAVGHFVTTTTFDLLSTTTVCWLLIRALRWGAGPPLLLAGVVTGLGFEAKPQVAIVAVVALLSIAVVGPRPVLRSPWLLGGVAAALLLALPYLWWQAIHGWPQVTVAGNVAGTSEGGRAGFVPFQLVMVGPLLVPVWIAGLRVPFRYPELRALRFVPVTYAALAALYVLADGKAYYLASLYPTLLGLGALPVAAWCRRRPAGRPMLAAALTISAAISAVIALPLLPVSALPGSAVVALNPDQAEMVGWPRFVASVARVWAALPAPQQQHTVVFTENYGEAGAIDLLGRAHGLPAAYSGHNAFSEWGPPPETDTSVIVVGYAGARDARPYFDRCRVRARVDDGVGLDNQEQGLPVMLCTRAAPWSRLWPQLAHDN